MIYSFSRLTMYENCPFRFKKKYVDGYEDAETLPLALGKGAHKGIEERVRGTKFDDAVLAGYLEGNMHEGIKLDELSRLIAKAPVHELRDVVDDVELHFQLPLSDEPNAPILQGYIDLITIDRRVFDWKSNRIPYKIQNTFQMGLYAWAMWKMYGWTEVSATLVFLRFKNNNKSTHIFKIKEMEIARKWAYDLAKEIDGKCLDLKMFPEDEAILFPSKPSSRCASCPFAIECLYKQSNIPHIKKLRKERRILNEKYEYTNTL